MAARTMVQTQAPTTGIHFISACVTENSVADICSNSNTEQLARLQKTVGALAEFVFSTTSLLPGVHVPQVHALYNPFLRGNT